MARASTTENGPPHSARREEILQTAKQLFAEQGYAATSTRDLAESCGLLAGSLYSHFRSKAQMLELIVGPFYDQLIARQREVVATDAPGVVRLEAMIRAVVELCARHKAEIRVLHYDWPHIAGNEELATIVAQSTVTLDLWLEVITDGVADTTLRASVRPETAMRVITSAIHGVLDRQRYSSRPDLARPQQVEKLADELVDTLISGLRATGGPTVGTTPRVRRPARSA